MTTKTTQAGIQTVIETGAQIKANHAIVPEWMAKLDDQAPYRVTKMVAPFGTYVLDVQPAELPSSMQIDNPRIDNHTKRALENPETIQGFALACVGSRRVSYWAFKGGWTYNEADAACYPNRNTAAEVMCKGAAYDKELFPFMRLVPIIDSEQIKGGMLPTVDGY